MRIDRVSWTTFRLPFVSTFATAHGSTAVREGAILRLNTSEGLEGLGEASPVPAFGGGSLADALKLLATCAPRLVGMELDQADALIAELDLAVPGAAAVACALDTAICDIRARAAGQSLAALLGGDAARPIPVNATVGVPDPTMAGLAARRAAEAGFGCVKLKVGIAGQPAAEVARIAAVRAALGPGIRLRLDANGAWDVPTAVAIVRAAERYDLELVEQPVAAADLAGMAQVRTAVDTPIAADEALGGPEQVRQIVAAGAADVLIVKPMIAGGLRRARDVIALAQSAGLAALVTTTIDAGVGVAAALHLATTLPAPSLACGLATGALLAGDLIAQPLIVRDGIMRIPDARGLGVTLDERQVARYGIGQCAWP